MRLTGKTFRPNTSIPHHNRLFVHQEIGNEVLVQSITKLNQLFGRTALWDRNLFLAHYVEDKDR